LWSSLTSNECLGFFLNQSFIRKQKGMPFPRSPTRPQGSLKRLCNSKASVPGVLAALQLRRSITLELMGLGHSEVDQATLDCNFLVRNTPVLLL